MLAVPVPIASTRGGDDMPAALLLPPQSESSRIGYRIDAYGSVCPAMQAAIGKGSLHQWTLRSGDYYAVTLLELMAHVSSLLVVGKDPVGHSGGTAAVPVQRVKWTLRIFHPKATAETPSCPGSQFPREERRPLAIPPAGLNAGPTVGIDMARSDNPGPIGPLTMTPSQPACHKRPEAE
jgi:hypothetical protein